MIKINEELIKKVFDEMVKYRPALQKYLIVDEDDDDDEIDHRVLGDLVIRNMPWPIGVELRRLFSGSMRQLDRMRLDQIFKTIERTMQFLSFVMLSQVWQDVKNNKFTTPESFSKELGNRIQVLSLGNFTWMLRSMCNMYNDNNMNWFMPEISENFDKKFLNALDFWVPERNEIGHYQINLSQEEIEKRCVEYEEKLLFILQKIAFVVKYKLVSVKEIIVNNTKNKPAEFHHIIDLLNSTDSDFKAGELNETSFTESKSVLLMKSIKHLEEYLNLSPLVIDTSSEIVDSKDKFLIKKDIFLYSKFRAGHLMYSGTEVTEKCDLRTLSNYDCLVEEFEDMIRTVCGE